MPALDATLSSRGDKLIYHDIKGYESDWRKHHTSSVTRDVWVYDFKAKSYTPAQRRSPARTATRSSTPTTTTSTT